MVFDIIQLFACKVLSVMAALEAWRRGGGWVGTGGVDFGYGERKKGGWRERERERERKPNCGFVVIEKEMG